MDENKNDKLVNSKADSDELMDDIPIFRRDSDDIIVSRQPAVRQNSQNNRQIAQNQANRQSNGAVIRPLKPTQPNRPVQQTVIRQPNDSKQTQNNSSQVNRQSIQHSAQSNAQIQQQNHQSRQQTTQPMKQNQNVTQVQNRNLQQVGRANNVPPTQTSRSVRANQPENLPVRRSPMTVDSRQYAQNTRNTPMDNDWQKVERRTAHQNSVQDSASSIIMSAVKAVVYIVFVIAVSIPLSMFVIDTANDVFAFKKEEKIIEVTIPEYTTIEELGDILGEAGIIKHPWAFKLWTNIKEKSNIEKGNYPEYVAGTYEVNTNQNYDYLRATFKKSTKRETVDIMIPEGYTVDEIIDLLVANGVSTREELVDAINNYPFDYRFVNELSTVSDRTYRLEGYLFPDTYQFYKDSSAVTAIDKFLQNFNTKFAEAYYDRCDDLGMTIDEAITLASMIEKEAKYATDMGDISAVFHNRLKYSATFPYLNCDATIAYAIQCDTGSRPDTLTGSDMDYDSPYNTYTNRGLPPGPISNPGLNAIRYALYPNEGSEYFYFVSNSSGHMLFAKTAAEHEKNIITARSQ